MGLSKHMPEELDYSRWIGVADHLLSQKDRKRYLMLKKAVEQVCDGYKAASVARQYGVTRSSLSYLLNRCTVRHPDGHYWGYRALVANCRQEVYERTKPTEQCDGADGYGLAGAFNRLLSQYPAINKIIFQTIRHKEPKLNIAALHSRIVKLLRSIGLTANDYPLNTKSAGYVALTKYVKFLIDSGNQELAAAKYGQSIHDGLQANTAKHSIVRPLRPLEIACYDEQKFPFIGTLVVEVDGKEIDVPLSRGYLCLLVDQDSAAILGYSLAISIRFRALNLLEAFESFAIPWSPRQLTIPGLRYDDGAGLPSGAVPGVHGQRIAVISVDNHLSHLANSVVSHLRIRTGAIIRFGKVRHWISRYVVEGLFSQMQNRGFSRLPSTTGSGPDAPGVNDPVGKAIKHRVRMEQMVELIDVLIANHNARPRTSLMSKTPNEVIATGIGDGNRLSVVPTFSEAFMKDPQIAVEIVSVTVRGSRQAGRAPYVQLDGAKYTNDLLRQHWTMLGAKLVAHIKGDFRKIRVFRADGSEYGVLEVAGHWARSFHTREMRKEINRLHKDRLINLSGNDPVAVYTDYLAKRATRNSDSKHPKITREAGQLANALHEMPKPVYRHRVDDTEEVLPEPTIVSRNRRAFFGVQNGDEK